MCDEELREHYVDDLWILSIKEEGEVLPTTIYYVEAHYLHCPKNCPINVIHFTKCGTYNRVNVGPLWEVPLLKGIQAKEVELK